MPAPHGSSQGPAARSGGCTQGPRTRGWACTPHRLPRNSQVSGPDTGVSSGLGRDGAGGGPQSHENRDLGTFPRVSFHYTSSWGVWAFWALQQNFSHSLKSSDKMNTDEANPVKSNKSTNRQKEKKVRECTAYPLVPSPSMPSTGTMPGVATELCPLVLGSCRQR